MLQMIVWGVISAATAGCTTVGGLWAIRFFLGFRRSRILVSRPGSYCRPWRMGKCELTAPQPRLLVLSLLLVHEEGAWIPDCCSVFRSSDFGAFSGLISAGMWMDASSRHPLKTSEPPKLLQTSTLTGSDPTQESHMAWTARKDSERGSGFSSSKEWRRS